MKQQTFLKFGSLLTIISLVVSTISYATPQFSVEIDGSRRDSYDILNFGFVGAGATKSKEVTIRNTGSERVTNLTINTFSASSSGFASSRRTLGTLYPQETIIFTVTFSPDSASDPNPDLPRRNSLFITSVTNQIQYSFNLGLKANDFTDPDSDDVTVGVSPANPDILVLGPIRKASQTLTTEANTFGSTITLSLTSSVPWLEVSSPSQFSPAAQADSTWNPGATAQFNLEADMSGLPLGVYTTTLVGSPGSWAVPVTVRNYQLLLPRVVEEGTNQGVSDVVFEVTQPDSTTYSIVSGADGFPSPRRTVGLDGQYTVGIVVNGSPITPDKIAIVSASASTFPVFEITPPPSFEEVVNSVGLAWTSPPTGWVSQTTESFADGLALRSGAITDSQQSTLQTSVTGPGTLSFKWKVSSESGWDYLRFKIAESTSDSITGDSGWVEKTVPIGAGTFTLSWVYEKDGSGDGGQDAGFLDEVEWIPEVQIFDDWATIQNLSGLDAATNATPYGDGVPNLLKYAFNMDGSAADVSVLLPGSGTSGLPHISLDGTGSNRVLRIEFLRRVGSGLHYTPQIGTTLDSFETGTGTSTPQSLGNGWERVVYTQPCDPSTVPRCFVRVKVEQE